MILDFMGVGGASRSNWPRGLPGVLVTVAALLVVAQFRWTCWVTFIVSVAVVVVVQLLIALIKRLRCQRH